MKNRIVIVVNRNIPHKGDHFDHAGNCVVCKLIFVWNIGRKDNEITSPNSPKIPCVYLFEFAHRLNGIYDTFIFINSNINRMIFFEILHCALLIFTR